MLGRASNLFHIQTTHGLRWLFNMSHKGTLCLRLAELSTMESVSGYQSGGSNSTYIINMPSIEVGLGSDDGNFSTSKEERLKEALNCLEFLEHEDMRTRYDTYVSLLQGCIKVKALEKGKQVHAHMVKSKFLQHIFIGNMLIDMYAKCGSIVEARRVFDEMPKRDVFTWTMMIDGYTKQGFSEEALKLFSRMEYEGVKPDVFTFASILKACVNMEALQHVHSHISRFKFEQDIFVGSTLIDMYAKWGSIEHARQVFDRMSNRNVVSWTAMIAGYVQHGYSEDALKFFWTMQHEGVKPNHITFVTVLNACADLRFFEQGKQMHALIMRIGLMSNIFVASSLIDMYAKCGSIEHAIKVFNMMPIRNVVSWTAMISGYVQNGHYEEALKLFWRMEKEGIKPNEVTFVNALNACASLGSFKQGKRIHACVNQSGFELNAVIGTTLIDMYAKCGSIHHAHKVFEKLPERDVISWTSLISGYAQHGHGKKAFQLALKMQEEGMKPDSVTCLTVLAACSHTGLADEAQCYFQSMCQDCSIVLTANHYACMVGLLGRVGCLEEAEELTTKMPFQPAAEVWRALLGACRIHGNLDFAKYAAELVLDLEPKNATASVLLANIYIASG